MPRTRRGTNTAAKGGARSPQEQLQLTTKWEARQVPPLDSILLSQWRIHPLIVLAGDLDPGLLRVLLDSNGLVIAKEATEEWVAETVGVAGLVATRQYELVQMGIPDISALTTVPRADGVGVTQVSKPGSTKLHMDGYQFPMIYQGRVIAGVGNMPDVESLFYPRVWERRLIFVFGGPAAFRKTAELGEELFAALALPQFKVEINEYKRKDPFLSEPDPFPIVYCDEIDWRFSIGGRTYTENADGHFALEILRQNLESQDAYSFEVESGDAAFFNQRLVAHLGIRPHVEGGTTLVRRLLRWQR